MFVSLMTNRRKVDEFVLVFVTQSRMLGEVGSIIVVLGRSAGKLGADTTDVPLWAAYAIINTSITKLTTPKITGFFTERKYF